MTKRKRLNKAASASSTTQLTAKALVAARLERVPLKDYPGEIPKDMPMAYSVQESAIDLWPDNIGGWKVGRIPLQFEQEFGSDRLAGPIFVKAINRVSTDQEPAMPVFVGGFAAIEAEYVAVIAEDAPPDKLSWSREEAEAMIYEVRIGLEIASSPFLGINDHGPALTVSDFGNNGGLVIGAAIKDWDKRAPESLTCETFVNNESVGTGGAYELTGGIVRSVQFMLELAATRGRPLIAGSLIATGQTTGIHEVIPGAAARIEFANDGIVRCRIVGA